MPKRPKRPMEKPLVILLDIDFTTFYEAKPRPYLKEFLERMSTQYEVYFYTAARHSRITDVCRIMYHQLGISDELVSVMNGFSLSRDNCPMINHPTSPSSSIEVKCLKKAAERLNVDLKQLRLLDDNPIYDNPDRELRIQTPAFYGQANDRYLLDFKLSL